MNEPKKYEVQLCYGADTWLVLPNDYGRDTVTNDPIAFAENNPGRPLRFREIPDGPLWRVEQETHAAGGGAYQTARLIPAEDGCRKGQAARLQADDMEVEIAELRRSAVAWEKSAAQFHRNECFYRDLIHQIGKPFGGAAMTSDDGSVQQDILALKVPELVVALQAERDALMGQLTKIGNACIVEITGTVEDGNETDPETLWKAISESVRPGHERNDEANALRGQLAACKVDLARIEGELYVFRTRAEEMKQQPEPIRLLTKFETMTHDRNEWRSSAEQATAEVVALRASLTAAKAELATCREARSAAENTLHVLGYERDKVGWFKPNHEEQQSATPPPSAQL